MFPDGAELGQCIGAFCVMDPRTSLTIHPHMKMIASRPRRHLIDQLILFTALDPLVIGGLQQAHGSVICPGDDAEAHARDPPAREAAGAGCDVSFFFLLVSSCPLLPSGRLPPLTFP